MRGRGSWRPRTKSQGARIAASHARTSAHLHRLLTCTLETRQRSSPSMPHLKPTPKPGKPPSKEVVPVGRRDVFKNSGAGRPETFKERPTTTKALVLRNGKHGAMGSGEVVLLSKIGGREKLDLLAGTRLHHQRYKDNTGLDAPPSLVNRGLYCQGGESSGNPLQIGTMRQDRRVPAKWCLIFAPCGLAFSAQSKLISRFP